MTAENGTGTQVTETSRSTLLWLQDIMLALLDKVIVNWLYYTSSQTILKCILR